MNPEIKDDIQQYMADKCGYFVDIAEETKFYQLPGSWISTEATQAEMNLWAGWEETLRNQRARLDGILGKIDQITAKLDERINNGTRKQPSAEQPDSH
jgi:hypothetical protein